MSALSIQPTYPIFTDIDGQPLEDGYVWIGVANLQPIGNPINVYWDAALTLPAAQPIRTLAGYPANSGTPARLYVNSDYSIRVMNKNGSVVYSAPAATERYSDAVISNINASKVIYDPAGIGAAPTTVQAKLRETVSVKDFGAVGDGVTDDTAAIQAAIDSTKTGQPNSGCAVHIPSVDASEGYVFSNLTLHVGAHLIGDGSHRTNLIRKIGSTGAAITDEGNPNKIIIQGFAVNMNGTTGSAIDFRGDDLNNIFGSEAWMDDIYVVRLATDANFQTDNGIVATFNASSMHNVRAYGFNYGIYIRGSVCLATDLIASNCVVNYRIVGTNHKIGNAYSESATTSHVEFGDGVASTSGCEIAQLSAHLLGSATTPQIIRQLARSTNVQLNAVLRGSINFRSGSVLTNLVTGEATGFVENITFQETNNTYAGFFTWNADPRQNQRVKVLGDADYNCQLFEPYSVYVFQGTTANRNFRLPQAFQAYGRQITVKNNDDASSVILRPNSSDGSIIYYNNSVATNNILIPAGGTITVECANNGFWYVTESGAAQVVEVTYDPASMATMTGTESGSFSVPAAGFGDAVVVSAPYSLGGVLCTGYIHSAGSVRISLFNPTGGTVDFASGTWTIRLVKKA